MSDPTPERKNISPEDYRRILRGLDLATLSLSSCSSKLDRSAIGGEAAVRVNDKVTYQKTEKSEIEIKQAYIFEAKNKATKKNYLIIKCEFCLLYTSKEEFTDEFFDTFKKANLPINSWPFFRELVYSLTSRMYIPPITLPLLKR